MPQIDVKLTSTADLSGVQRMQAGVSQLQQHIEKKWEIPDVGKSLLNGFGLGSGFAVAETAFTKWAALFQEIADGAKEVEAFVESIHKKAEDLAKMKFDNFISGMDPGRQLEELNKQLGQRSKRLEDLRKEKDALDKDFETAGATSRGTISGSAFDPFAGRYGNFSSMKTVGDKIAALQSKKQDEIDNAEKDQETLRQRIGGIKKPLEEARIGNVVADWFRDIDQAAEQAAAVAADTTKSIEDGVKNYLQTALKPQLDAEHKLIEARQKSAVEKQKSADTANDASIARQLADIDARRALIENDSLTTQQEKTALLLPLLAEENRLIEQRIALRRAELESTGDDKVRLDLQDKIDALQKQLAQNKGKSAGLGSPETLAIRDAKGLRDLSDPSQHYQSARGGAMGGVMSWLQQVGTLGDQVATNLANVFNSATSGIANSITGLINRTMTWGQALANIGTTIIQGVIQAFANMVAQWIVKQIVMAVAGKAIQAAQVAAAAPIAMATAAMWAVPATLATIATMGGAAAAAPAEIMMANMAVMGTSLAGFEAGGFPSGRNAIVRVNENGQESILNANATRNLGSAAINALNSGQPLFPSAASMLTRPGYSPAQSRGRSDDRLDRRKSRDKFNVAFLDRSDRGTLEAIKRTPAAQTFIVDVMKKNRGQFGLRS